MNERIASEHWAGRRVWIIGASSGIGEALARQLLVMGAYVVLSARRREPLDALAGVFGQARVLPLDASDRGQWRAAAAEAQSVYGGLDLVVFVAGRYEPQRAWELDTERVRASFELNVLSVYDGLAQVLPQLIEQGSGGVMLVASVSGYTGLPKALAYGPTKAALINLAESLYFDLAPLGVSVYLVNPGFVATPMTRGNDFPMPGLVSPAEAAQAMVKGMAEGRFEIRFPKRFTWAMRLLSRVPYRWRFSLLHRMTGL